MRTIFGPQAVAAIESLVFRAQDAVTGFQYDAGIQQAEAPWESAPRQLTPPSNSGGVVEAPPEAIRPAATPPAAETPPAELTPEETQDRLPEAPASPTLTPTATIWQLADLRPFGSLEGEGAWQPYLYNGEGRVVAMRTFLQPDPERPYTIVAIVAFDLTSTRLHFVLGFNEPSMPDGPRGEGLIAEEDREEGALLAAFNGGFRAANGWFGAMAGEVEALPPIDELATVGIYRDGEVRIGNWGDEILDSPDIESWRQNARLIIQGGEISPRVYNDSVTDWGASISNQIVTRRSGLGLDKEADTLYYFAGPSLSMPALADAMQVAGVHDGMLLDINHFWVHFTAIKYLEGEAVAEPLLPEDMIDQIDRYLGPSPADFFYVTIREGGE